MARLPAVPAENCLILPFMDHFVEDEPDEIVKLREITAGLKSRLADVYEALLVQYAGGRETISQSSITRKWGVSANPSGTVTGSSG